MFLHDGIIDDKGSTMSTPQASPAQPRRIRRPDPLYDLGREGLRFGPVRVRRASDRVAIAKAQRKHRASSTPA
jgi:hypothetical protein